MFEELDPQQLAAATHGDGPLLIVAGAGTGKTMTLVARVAFLLDRGVLPEQLLLLTFTRRAAREMLTRARQLSGRAEAARVRGGTFHSVANRLLRTVGRAVGLSPDFTVLDQSDAADVMDLIREEGGYATSERRFPRKQTLVAIYSRAVNEGSRLKDVIKRHYPWCLGNEDDIREIFEAYTRRKRELNVLDFDDLLLYWRALASSPEIGPALAGSFQHILVDEYQDTNSVQADILAAMRPTGGPRNLTVVGDDAQAIYGFRAATVQNILGFAQRFEGAAILKLERNYRSTQPILDASNAMIAEAPRRHDKTLHAHRPGGARPALRVCADEAEQSDTICREVLARREEGTPLKRQAVLFRAAHHSDALEVELARRNIPFVKYGGLKFLEAAHVKDAVALLRILENPHDEMAWFRVLQLPQGMGPGTARRTIAELEVRGASDADPKDPLVRFITEAPSVPKPATEETDELRAALSECRDEELTPPSAQLDRLRKFLDPVLIRRYDSARARIQDLEQLTALASAYRRREPFLSELTLDPPSSTGDLAGPPHLDDDWLVLSTIHSAKGLEWDVVYVIHAADGHIPSDMATGDAQELEEERRLLYVAMTRARDGLHISFPQRYYRRPTGDSHSYAQPSRFLTQRVRAYLDEHFSEPVEQKDSDAPAIGSVDEVDELLSDLWR
jgi:DNA helicase-2/ATP-dependent DNA helicase PcrA